MMGVGQDDRRPALSPARSAGRSSTATQMIEARTGRTVREIFDDDGEAAFRALETEALLDALAVAGAGRHRRRRRRGAAPRRTARRSRAADAASCGCAPTRPCSSSGSAHRRPPAAARRRSGGHAARGWRAERDAALPEVADVIVDVDGRTVDDGRRARSLERVIRRDRVPLGRPLVRRARRARARAELAGGAARRRRGGSASSPRPACRASTSTRRAARRRS